MPHTPVVRQSPFPVLQGSYLILIYLSLTNYDTIQYILSLRILEGMMDVIVETHVLCLALECYGHGTLQIPRPMTDLSLRGVLMSNLLTSSFETGSITVLFLVWEPIYSGGLIFSGFYSSE